MKAPNSLVVAIPSDVRTLDPSAVEDTISMLVCNQAFEGLVRFVEGSIQTEPALAESWTWSADFRTWTFRLRPGVKFSDGSPLTVGDVVSSFREGKETGGKCVERGLDHVVFTLEEPNSRFLDVLAQMPYSIRKKGPAGLLGTGPYRIVSRKIGREIILSRNENSRITPHIGEVTIRVVPFTTLLGKGLVDGEIDLTDSVTPAILPILRRAPNVKLHHQMGLNTGFLAMNTSRPQLADPRIRTAIAASINRAPMLDRFFPTGFGQAARSLLPPDIHLPKRPDFVPFDQQKAKELMVAAGYRPSTILRIRPTWAPRPYLPDPPAIAWEIARMLRAVGFSVAEEPTPNTTEYQALKSSGNFDMLVAGWIADDTVPFTFLADNLLSTRIGSTNIPRYSNATFDALLHRMRLAAGPTLDSLIDEAEMVVARDVPLAPLFHGAQIGAAGEQITGRILHPASAMRLASIARSGGATWKSATG